MAKERELSEKQKNAIRTARRIAEYLIRRFPEIAEDYRNGMHQMEIAERYVPGYMISPQVAKSGVSFALEELLDEEERREFAFAHRSEHMQAVGRISGPRNALICFQEKRGMFAMTVEERFEATSKGGKVGGKKTFELKIGVHGLTRKRRKEISRIALQAKGVELYEGQVRDTEFGKINEKGYIEQLRIIGYSWNEITKMTNESFCNNRTSSSLQEIYLFWKKRGDIVGVNMGNKDYDSIRMTTEFGDLTEIDYILQLRNDKVTYREIAQQINRIFGNERNVTAIRLAVSRRKSLK